MKDRGNAQSSCAAQFIGNHLPENWLDETETHPTDPTDCCAGGAGGAGGEGKAGQGEDGGDGDDAVGGVGTWIHIDMAAPVYDKSSERATGYGVALLTTLCGAIPGWTYGVV